MVPDHQPADTVREWAPELALRFLTSRTWPQRRQIYAEHPELLEPEVDHAFAALLRQFELEGDTSGQAAVRQVRALLAACRDAGPELGFNQAQIESVDEQLTAVPASSPVRIQMLETLGQLWSDRFGITQAEADLDHAVDTARQAATASAGLTAEARELDLLSGLLRRRFLSFHSVHDIFEMLEIQRAAVRQGQTAPQRYRCLVNMHLATRINLYVDVMAQMRVLDRETAETVLAEAVDAARVCLSLAGPDSVDRINGLQALVEALRLRYQCFGSLEDLDAAIDGYETLVSLTGSGSPDGKSSQRNLARTLRERSKRTNSREDLSRAAQTLSSWLTATPLAEAGRAEAVAELEQWQAELGGRGL
jgi:hypothetical protein